MKARMTATIAIAVVAMMVFAVAGATTFSWFTDTEETDITITTGSLDVETQGFYVKSDGNELTNGDVLPDNISIIYDDGRSATDAWKDVNTISIAGNPVDANIEIGYQVTFTADIDYKYLIDVVVPDQIKADVTVIDESDDSKTNVGYGLWKFPTKELSEGEKLSVTYDVKIIIASLPMGLVDANVKIINMITQYLDTNEHPIDTWNGVVPDSMPKTLIVDNVNHLISINDADAFAYLNTLVNDPGFYDEYGSKWKYSIELNANINLNNETWTPIILSNFVKFDGKGHSIYNLNVEIEGDSAGLFGVVSCNDIGVTYVENFNLINAKVKGNHNVGAVIGSSTQGAVSNVVVENADLTGMKYVGGIFGWGNGSVNDCTVMNSSITIPEGGEKEAGGLIGYLSNDGIASTTNKIISGNHVENVFISAPSVASGLVSQPNSSNIGGALIEVRDNTLNNVIIETADDKADCFVSYNVGDKTIVVDNDSVNCEARKNVAKVTTKEGLSDAIVGGKRYIYLGAGNYIIPSAAQGETLTIVGAGPDDTKVTVTKVGTGGENCDYGFDGPTVTLKNLTISTNSSTYIGYARMNGTYDNCTFDGTYTLYGDSVFNNCTFNVSGDVYNIWTWGAPNATFNNCTFNNDGKALLLYGTANTKLTVDGCTFNDKGGLTDLKAAIEIGNDYGKSYELIVKNTTVNGYEINDEGINTGTTLWANKNSMGTDKLNVVVDGVDVY